MGIENLMKTVSGGFVGNPYWTRRGCIKDAVAQVRAATTPLSLRYSFEDVPRSSCGGIVLRNRQRNGITPSTPWRLRFTNKSRRDLNCEYFTAFVGLLWRLRGVVVGGSSRRHRRIMTGLTNISQIEIEIIISISQCQEITLYEV